MTLTELDNFKQMANAVAERTEELIERARAAEARVAVLEAALRPFIAEESLGLKGPRFVDLTLYLSEYEAACRAMEDAKPERSRRTCPGPRSARSNHPLDPAWRRGRSETDAAA